MASVQRVILGHSSTPVQEALEQISHQKLIERLWSKDPSLWSQEPSVQNAIRQRLGWLTAPSLMRPHVASLNRFVQELQASGITHALLLGMGGSGLFAEVCANTLGGSHPPIRLTVLDTTDPTAIQRAQESVPLERLLFVVSSKSGTTSEVEALAAYFSALLRKTGRDPHTHCIAITDSGTPLEKHARESNFREVFTHGPDTGADVGGRFSAFTYFGLVPAALVGIDVDRLLERALKVFSDCQKISSLEENSGAQLGVILGQLATVGRNKMTLVCPAILESFGTWVEQLLAESTGKSGKGIVPIVGEPMREALTYADDRLFVELQWKAQFDPVISRHVLALADAGHPVVRIHWDDLYDLGGEVAKWCVATAVAGHQMAINPFDEPNVTQSKERTKHLLSLHERDGHFPSQVPLLVDGGLTVYGKLPSASLVASKTQHLDISSSSQDVSGANENPHKRLIHDLVSWFEQVKRGDYIALLSFLPRTYRLDMMLQAIRGRIHATLGNATMLQFGPRYLHSTGQLYKGGSDRGLFLLFTAQDPMDLEIPGSPFSFSILKQAQALGDFQAMQQQNRRVLHIYLGGDPERAIGQLSDTIEEVVVQVSTAHKTERSFDPSTRATASGRGLAQDSAPRAN